MWETLDIHDEWWEGRCNNCDHSFVFKWCMYYQVPSLKVLMKICLLAFTRISKFSSDPGMKRNCTASFEMACIISSLVFCSCYFHGANYLFSMLHTMSLLQVSFWIPYTEYHWWHAEAFEECKFKDWIQVQILTGQYMKRIYNAWPIHRAGAVTSAAWSMDSLRGHLIIALA